MRCSHSNGPANGRAEATASWAARGAFVFALSVASIGCTGSDPAAETPTHRDNPLELIEETSGVTARLQAISVVSPEIAWASGLDGSVLRTADGGSTWARRVVPDADELQFRDVHAVNAEIAYLLSAGEGPASRLYKTLDGGESWQLLYQAQEPEAFLDCFDFWSPERGVAYGDSIAGELFVLVTEDGREWLRVSADQLPPAQDGEGGFAASGSCVVTGDESSGWITTGAAATARLLTTLDYGLSWSAEDTPAVAGEMAGLMALAWYDNATIGVAVGGDLAEDAAYPGTLLLKSNAVAWREIADRAPVPGPYYGVAWSQSRNVVIVVGPNGAFTSRDLATSFGLLSQSAYWSVDFDPSGRVAYLVGPEGRIARLDVGS